MNGSVSDLASWGTGALIGLGLLLLAELGLMLAALIVLIRTPKERVTIGGRKWAWALIVIFFNLVGPLLFFFLGRKPAAAAEPVVAAPATDRAAVAADALYGAPPAAVPAAPTPPAPAAAPAAPVAAPAPNPLDDPSVTPESLAGDPEIGADGTGAGELP